MQVEVAGFSRTANQMMKSRVNVIRPGFKRLDLPSFFAGQRHEGQGPNGFPDA